MEPVIPPVPPDPCQVRSVVTAGVSYNMQKKATISGKKFRVGKLT